MKWLLTIFVVAAFLMSCKDTDTPVVIHDTVTVHDTIQVSDSGYAKTIDYFKQQNVLLWQVVDLMEVANPKNITKLIELDNKIVSLRQKHNREVTREFIDGVKSIVKK